MKKIIVLMLALLLTGCGMTNAKKEEILYDSLEKAFTSIYINEGIGLAVYDSEIVELDKEKWYKVAINDYNSLEKINSLTKSVFEENIKEELDKKTEKRYKEIDGHLYTKADGVCSLDFQLDDNLKNNIKEKVKINKIKMNKIIFEYNNKEYTAKKKKDNYIFKNKIFECK